MTMDETLSIWWELCARQLHLVGFLGLTTIMIVRTVRTGHYVRCFFVVWLGCACLTCLFVLYDISFHMERQMDFGYQMYLIVGTMTAMQPAVVAVVVVYLTRGIWELISNYRRKKASTLAPTAKP